MADLKKLREIASTALGSCTPDEIQKALDDSAKKVLGKVWRSTAAAFACGFGKGLLIMAGVIVVGGALITGIGAWGGAAGLVGMTFGQGLVAGATAALQSIFTGGGALTLAMGGVMGSVMDVRRVQNRINAETAQVQAAAYEILRTQGNTPQRANTLSAAIPQVDYAAREMERRQAGAAGLAK